MVLADLNLQALIKQASPDVYSDGNQQRLRGTRLGQLLTVNWKENLVLAGVVQSMHIGTLTAGADVGRITGGGAGTTIDSDQPEFICGPDTGYMIPLEVRITMEADQDANADQVSAVIFADRTQAPPTSVSGTPGIITPNNALDGGAAAGQGFRAFGGVTTDITDPVMSELLDYYFAQAIDNGTAASAHQIAHKLLFDPSAPTLLKGPCSLVAAYGGTIAVTGMLTAKVAIVPASWFE